MLKVEKARRKNVQKGNPAAQKQQNPAAKTRLKLPSCNDLEKRIYHLPKPGGFFMPLKNLFQFVQVSNGVGWFYMSAGIYMVYKDRIHSCIDGALDIRIQVVADHDRLP